MTRHSLRLRRGRLFALAAVALSLGACGGAGGSNPLNNPPQVNNSSGATGQSLSFAYFEYCIFPIFQEQLQINLNGTQTTNTCSSAGCHADKTGTGGAFRIISTATPLAVTDPANTPDVIRASDMYKNFYSAQGEVVINQPTQSLLVRKPLLLNVLHGGGLVFTSQSDPHIKRMEYWIGNPMPAGQDEFSKAGYNLFSPPLVDGSSAVGTCNTN
jgi:hypothetical protein